MKKILLPLVLLAGGIIILYVALNSGETPDRTVDDSMTTQAAATSEIAVSVDSAKRENSSKEASAFLKAYWDNAIATKGDTPHGWSEIEKNLKPEACAQCHAEQFNAWKKSLHAAAYSPGLIGQFPGMGHVQGNDNCLTCHAPLKEQKYISKADMLGSLKDKLQHPKGFSETGKLAEPGLPLRHAGVTCAACHVRGWQRFGPPQRGTGAVGKVKGSAHGGFTGVADFETSNFCASCHQFPQSYAINGKPLENTVKEWKQSRFAREGVHCQNCHMPDRKHEFKGIHDKAMTLKGLNISLNRTSTGVALSMESTWIGHAFPTYVTPKVIIVASALDDAGQVLRNWQWEIIREVYFDSGWKERRDTRLMPGETRAFEVSDVPPATNRLRYRIKVVPDYFYKGVYKSLLSGTMEADAETLIRQAASQADANDYILYEDSVTL